MLLASVARIWFASSHKSAPELLSGVTVFCGVSAVSAVSDVRVKCPRTDVLFRQATRNGAGARVSRRDGIGTTFALSLSKTRFLIRWTAVMKFKYETLLLRSLFGACVAICAMTVGSMLLA